ncbi:MAG: helix-turn-helix transcriptional regulator [Solirubrobacterales bacterium]
MERSRPPVSVPDAKALGDAIRTRRKAAGLTQGELADAAGTSLRFVSEVERGKPTARLQGVLSLLAELGLELHVKPR